MLDVIECAESGTIQAKVKTSGPILCSWARYCCTIISFLQKTAANYEDVCDKWVAIIKLGLRIARA